MQIDSKTQRAYPSMDVRNLFPTFGNIPVSANFNGCIDAGRERAVHVNPGAGVRLCRDKAKLLSTLQGKGYPVPKHVRPAALLQHGYFSLQQLEKTFGNVEHWAEKPWYITHPSGTVAVHDMADAFDCARYLSANEYGVAYQPSNHTPKVIQVGAIPAMAGHPMIDTDAKSTTHSGIFEEEVIFNNLPAEIRLPLIQLCLTMLEECGLDVATLTIAFSPEKIDPELTSVEVYNVSTNFVPAYSHGISQFMTRMVNAYENSRKKSKK